MGRPRKHDPMRERHQFLAKHWDVLQDAFLCGMTPSAIARKRMVSQERVREILVKAWTLEMCKEEVAQYMWSK